MNFEQALLAALAAVTGGLVYLFKMLWTESQRCAADRQVLQAQINTLNNAAGIAAGERTIMGRCPLRNCPWRPAVKFGAAVFLAAVGSFLLSSCALPFDRTYSGYGFSATLKAAATPTPPPATPKPRKAAPKPRKRPASTSIATPAEARTTGPGETLMAPAFRGAEAIVISAP